MNAETKYYINNIAERLANREYSAQVLDVEKLVKDLGGTIIEKEAFDDLCDTTAIKTSNNTFIINIAKNQDAVNKRKSIARSLGNVVLHMGFISNHPKWDKFEDGICVKFSTFTHEVQASEFAMALLMPKSEYKKILERNTRDNVVDVSEVAKHFQVSTYDAINRGKSLGLINIPNRY